MMGKTHQVFGLACSMAAGQLLGYDMVSLPMAEVLGSGFMTSKLPDIDMKIGIKHRGSTHYVLTALLLGLGVWYPTHSTPLTIGAFTGYASHLIGDMNTVYGVPLLGPFSKRRFRFPWAYKMPKAKGRYTMHPFESLIFLLSIAYLFGCPFLTK